MPITINGVELTDADMARELPEHADAPQPLRHATLALVLRRLLLDEAARQGIAAASETELIESLFARVLPPAPSGEALEQACRRHYAQHPQRYSVGELVEADHILFQLTPGCDPAALRARAEAVLAQLLPAPQRFDDIARSHSNCPSGAVGGSLGQLGRGDTVPEFEAALFALAQDGIAPHLVHSRHGFHILRRRRHVPGRLLPFEQVQPRLARALLAAYQARAQRHYLQQLAAGARIEGVALPELAGDGSPLLQ